MNYHFKSLTLHNLISREFELFKTQYDQNPISSEQDIRGIGIVWSLCIGSDYLDYSKLHHLVSFTEKKLYENNYHSEHWYKIPSLLGASYLITKEDKFLEELYYLIDCKQASSRIYIHTIMGLLINDIYEIPIFYVERVLNNIRFRHLLWQEGVKILLSIAKNNLERDHFEKVCRIAQKNKLNQELTPWFDNPSKIPNSFFLGQFSEVKSYLISKLLNYRSQGYHKQTSLFQNNDDNNENGIKFNFIERESRHPLMQPTLDFSNIIDKKEEDKF